MLILQLETLYIKPVQTGYPVDSDARLVVSVGACQGVLIARATARLVQACDEP